MKYSIIIPVYNVDKYLTRCLESILKQTYNNYEVIVVNDGSPDNSQSIIDKYVKKDNRIKGYIKENGGLSDARNYGIQYVTGDYIMFIDSDDYVEKELLFKINELVTIKKYDAIKYLVNVVSEEEKIIRKESVKDIGNVSIKEVFKYEYSEPAWTFVYNRAFWFENNFKYSIGKIHEDYGLTPLLLARASSICILDYYGYNYVQRSGSIVNGAEKLKKRAYDMLYHYDNIMNSIDSKIIPENIIILRSFMANGIINGARLLNGKELENFIKELKRRKVCNHLIDDSLTRKIKKMVIKFNMKFYIKHM